MFYVGQAMREDSYRAALKGSSWVVRNWVKMLRFVYLLQAGERNFSPHIHTTWEVPFSASLYYQQMLAIGPFT